MNAWIVWSLIVGGLGILFVGIFIGENNKVREGRRNKVNSIIRLEEADTTWLQAGFVALVFAAVLTIIGYNPSQKLMENADQIRSSEITAEEEHEH